MSEPHAPANDDAEPDDPTSTATGNEPTDDPKREMFIRAIEAANRVPFTPHPYTIINGAFDTVRDTIERTIELREKHLDDPDMEEKFDWYSVDLDGFLDRLKEVHDWWLKHWED